MKTFSETASKPADIGRIIRQIRNRLKLTRIEAAALCGVGTRFLSELENGKEGLHLGKVLKVLASFGLVLTIRAKDMRHG